MVRAHAGQLRTRRGRLGEGLALDGVAVLAAELLERGTAGRGVAGWPREAPVGRDATRLVQGIHADARARPARGNGARGMPRPLATGGEAGEERDHRDSEHTSHAGTLTGVARSREGRRAIGAAGTAGGFTTRRGSPR